MHTGWNIACVRTAFLETELSKTASRCPTDNLMETLFLFIQTVLMVLILFDMQEDHKIKSDVLDYV